MWLFTALLFTVGADLIRAYPALIPIALEKRSYRSLLSIWGDPRDVGGRRSMEPASRGLDWKSM
jgi:hypothetical protein